MQKRIEELQKIADEYNVDVSFNHPIGCIIINYNQAIALPDDNMIVMSEYNNIDKFTIAFFHELAHCKYNDFINLPSIDVFSDMIEEATCWDIGFRLAKKYGYIWDKNHLVYKYAYQCMLTYTFDVKDDMLRDGLDIRLFKKDMESYIERIKNL